MYTSKLRVSKNNDTTIFNNDDSNRVIINRGIYSNGRIRILCVIRGGVNTDVLYNRGMRSKGAENNSGILFLFLYIIRVSSNANKHNVHIYNQWDNRLCDINGI